MSSSSNTSLYHSRSPAVLSTGGGPRRGEHNPLNDRPLSFPLADATIASNLGGLLELKVYLKTLTPCVPLSRCAGEGDER